MKKSIKWFSCFLAGLSFVLCAQAAAMYIIDPYQYFRKATSYKPLYMPDSARYMNPGVIKNFDYDSAIVGNSMTENFLVQDVNKKLGWNTIKLSMEGATSYEMSFVYKALFREGKVKNILTTFDVFATELPKDYCTYEMPKYLYEDSFLGTLQYLLKFNILKKQVPLIYKNQNSRYTDINRAYYWGDAATYSVDNIKRHFLAIQKIKSTSELKEPVNNTLSMEYVNHVLSNFNDHFYKYIKENPQVQFHVILPPYSLVYWKYFYYNGVLDEHLECRKEVLAKLLSCPNVKVYDFQRDKNLVANYPSYRDMVHYGPGANAHMIEYLNSGKYDLTKDNYLQSCEELEKLVMEAKLPF